MATDKQELPNAGLWANGFIDITRWIKDSGTLIRLIVIIALGFLLWTGIKEITGLFKRKPMETNISNVTGKVYIDNTAEKKTKFGLFNLW